MCRRPGHKRLLPGNGWSVLAPARAACHASGRRIPPSPPASSMTRKESWERSVTWAWPSRIRSHSRPGVATTTCRQDREYVRLLNVLKVSWQWATRPAAAAAARLVRALLAELAAWRQQQLEPHDLSAKQPSQDTLRAGTRWVFEVAAEGFGWHGWGVGELKGGGPAPLGSCTADAPA